METHIIQSKIHALRGQRVMLDFDLAALYDLETKYLKRSVKRNIRRFPDDFMFELTREEWAILRCNFGTSNQGGRRYMPFAFTEQGVAMLSTVLNSEKAIHVNIAIMRAFVAMRHFALTFAELAEKMAELEAKTGKDIADIHEVLRWLGEENQSRSTEIAALEPTSTSWENRRAIGFKSEE